MRLIQLAFLTLTITFISCSTKTEHEVVIPQYNTYITGHVKSIGQVTDYTVNLLIQNLITDDSDRALTFLDSADYTFEFNFNLESPKMMLVRYIGQNFYLYVNASDSIHIEIQADDNYPPNCEFAVTDSHFQEINSLLDPWIKAKEEIIVGTKLPDIVGTSFDDYNKAGLRISNRIKKRFVNYVAENKITNKQFLKIAKPVYEFGYPSLLIYYKIQSYNYNLINNKHKELPITTPDIEMEKTMRMVMDSLDLNDPDLLKNSYFEYFLNAFDEYIGYEVRDLCESRYSDCTEDLYNQTYFEFLDEHYNSQILDLLKSRFLYRKIVAYKIQKRPELITQFTSLLDSSKNDISSENRLFLEKEFERVRKSMEDTSKGEVRTVETTTEGIEFWKNIIAGYKGKTLYVKFWAPWCIPCMVDWKSVKNLAEAYSGNDVRVLAICIDTEEDAWKKSLKDLPVSVDHIYLTRDQSNAVKTYYDFNAIPRNIIIDKEGNVIHSNAPECGTPDGRLNTFVVKQISDLL